MNTWKAGCGCCWAKIRVRFILWEPCEDHRPGWRGRKKSVRAVRQIERLYGRVWPCPMCAGPVGPACDDPRDLLGAPIGMYHCPGCGTMQMAGLPHIDCDGCDGTGRVDFDPRRLR